MDRITGRRVPPAGVDFDRSRRMVAAMMEGVLGRAERERVNLERRAAVKRVGKIAATAIVAPAMLTGSERRDPEAEKAEELEKERRKETAKREVRERIALAQELHASMTTLQGRADRTLAEPHATDGGFLAREEGDVRAALQAITSKDIPKRLEAQANAPLADDLPVTEYESRRDELTDLLREATVPVRRLLAAVDAWIRAVEQELNRLEQYHSQAIGSFRERYGEKSDQPKVELHRALLGNLRAANERARALLRAGTKRELLNALRRADELLKEAVTSRAELSRQSL